MPLSTKGSGKELSEEYHEMRRKARESLGEFEFGEIDIERYDLDEIEFDRKMRVDTVKTEPRVESEGSAKAGRPTSRDDPVRD